MTPEFKETIIKLPFLYCKDDQYQYIIDAPSGRIIYQKAYTSYTESYFCFCGNTPLGPAFYDARQCVYLYPEDSGYRVYPQLFNHPVILNRQNKANITESDTGVGVIDSFGNAILENIYDEIRLEIKVIGVKKDAKDEKIIPLSKSVFKRGNVTDVDEWV